MLSCKAELGVIGNNCGKDFAIEGDPCQGSSEHRSKVESEEMLIPVPGQRVTVMLVGKREVYRGGKQISDQGILEENLKTKRKVAREEIDFKRRKVEEEFESEMKLLAGKEEAKRSYFETFKKEVESNRLKELHWRSTRGERWNTERLNAESIARERDLQEIVLRAEALEKVWLAMIEEERMERKVKKEEKLRKLETESKNVFSCGGLTSSFAERMISAEGKNFDGINNNSLGSSEQNELGVINSTNDFIKQVHEIEREENWDRGTEPGATEEINLIAIKKGEDPTRVKIVGKVLDKVEYGWLVPVDDCKDAEFAVGFDPQRTGNDEKFTRETLDFPRRQADCFDDDMLFGTSDSKFFALRDFTRLWKDERHFQIIVECLKQSGLVVNGRMCQRTQIRATLSNWK